jgi:hypothetical protein
MMLSRLIPSKAALYAFLAAFGAGVIAWLRLDAKRDQRRDAQIKDYENAEDIETRVTDNRADPERLRKYEDTGWRD